MGVWPVPCSCDLKRSFCHHLEVLNTFFLQRAVCFQFELSPTITQLMLSVRRAFPRTFSACSSLPQTVCLLAPLAWLVSLPASCPHFCSAALLESPRGLLGACLWPIRDQISMQTSAFTPWASAHGFLANNPTLSVHSGLQSALHLRKKTYSSR